jgi:protein-S-isoprenylcysteine O-methyltransferase Ste14
MSERLARRSLLSVLALPGMVAVVIPLLIARRFEVSLAAPAGVLAAASLALGIAFGAVGLVLFLACIRLFSRQGRGTLAPWDPPRRLVIDGPYRYVRNPMISGVLCVLLGEAAVLRSLPHLVWAAAFALLNALYIPLAEEPGLERRFGAAYRRYREHVPRLVPRLRPWHDTEPPAGGAHSRDRIGAGGAADGGRTEERSR